MVRRTFPQRIAVLVDVQNMFYSARNLKQSKLDYGKMLEAIVGNRFLVRAVAYVIQRPDINQSGFIDAITKQGFETQIKELKLKESKGSWDVGLTVDALQMSSKIDVFTLVTGDGDFVPLASALRSCGCRVEIASFQGSTARELVEAAHEFIPIQDEWTFKEKKFEKPAKESGEHKITSIRPVSPTGLGSTAHGEISTESLPDDDVSGDLEPAELPSNPLGIMG